MNFGQNLSGENDGKNSPPKTDADFITSIFDNEVLTARTDVAPINSVTGEPIKTAEFILDQLSKPIADSTKNLVSVNEDRVLIIKLNPESLGTVTAKLERGPEGQLKVTLTVDKQETYDIIRATQKEIIAALEKVTEGDNTSFSFNLAKGNQGQAGYENGQNRFHGNNADTYTLKPREDTYSNNAALVYNNNDSVNIIL
jgi:flagellar hook-length control protein FliK